jgi:hypothetical protein
MIVPSDPDYKLTKLIKLGKSTMNGAFKLLADWIDLTYDVKTINIIYDKIENNKIPRLNIIFEKEKDGALFISNQGYNPDRQREIAYQLKSDLLSKKYKTDKLLIIFSVFETIAKIETYWLISKDEINKLKSELNMNDLWTIRSNAFCEPTFLFYTDNQVNRYSKNEMKASLNKKCFELVKKHDEFDYFKIEGFSIQLDSKEKFESFYKGNWFYYDKR